MGRTLVTRARGGWRYAGQGRAGTVPRVGKEGETEWLNAAAPWEPAWRVEGCADSAVAGGAGP